MGGAASRGLGLALLAAGLSAAPAHGEATYRVPYRLAPSGHVIVRARIAGQGSFNFVLDTGAPALTVNRSVGNKLKLQPGPDGWAELPSFEIEGGLAAGKVRARVETPAQLEGINALGLAGADLHGVLGYSLLARYRITLDLAQRHMSWTDLGVQPAAALGAEGGTGAQPAELRALAGLARVAGGLAGARGLPPPAPRGSLGLEVRDRDGTAEVVAVLQGSPAARAGMRPGDRIVRCQDTYITSSAELLRAAAGLAAGQEVRLGVRRDGRERAVGLVAEEGL